MTDQGFQCGKDMINPPETESECVCAFQDPRSNWGCGSSEASSRIEKWLTPREAPARCRRRAPIPAHPRTKLPESQSKRFPFLDRRGQREAGIRTPRITRFAATTSESFMRPVVVKKLEQSSQRNLSIFISYASEDKELVAGIAAEIKAAFPLSLDVHRDEDFKLGENWKDDIENGLDKADILLVIFTDRPKPSFSFTGYEIGYFNSSIKVRPNIKDGLKRLFIPMLIGDVSMPDTMYYVQGAKFDAAKSIKIAETIADKQNDETWSKNPTNPTVTLLNRISDTILAFSGTERTQEILASIQETNSKAAKKLYADIHRYLQGRVFSEIFPERKIVIKSETPIEFESDGADLNDCRVELLGKSFDSFGIPEFVSASREFTWSDFVARMNPTAIGPWREGIRLLVSSVLQGSGDNYMVISTMQKDIAYRLFVSRVVTYVSRQTEIHIYIVEIKSREYGDKETTQLLKAVSVGLTR
jgi:hypothetical protein